MMKKICIGWCTLALVCAVCSCSRDDDGAVAGQALEITFSGSRVGEEWVDSARTVTRATDDTWTNNDAIGIYVLPAGATALTDATKPNSKYVYSSGTATFSPASTNQTLYYPGDGTDVKFVAYYPYSSTAATANTVTFSFAGQGTKTLKEGVDFCYHRGTESYSKTNLMTSMAFQHKFSKIRMTVKRGTSGLNPANLTGVTLKGMPASATVDLNTLMSAADDDAVLSAFTISGETDITAYIQSKTPTQAVVEAIVAPHTIAKGKSIDFTIGRETKTYTFDAPLTLAPGKVYDFVFTLNTKSFDGMTNCYMVAPGETLNFKVSRAYTYNATTKTFNDALHVGGNYNGTNDKFDVDIVWADCAGLFSSLTVDDVAGHQATVTVQANTTNKVGNAVVALKKKGTGNIVWSYHIWVTKYKPDDDAAQDNAVYEHKGNTNNNGYYFIFMDRNLGASFAGKNNTASSMGTGLYYQWGRKDPFPDTDGTLAVGSFSRVQTTDILGTIPNTIKNPNVFYYNTSSAQYYDWHQPIRIDTLWDHSNNQKTIYDPCPSGWRVPRYTGTAATDSPWYGFTISGKTFSYGYVFDTNAIYPAPGLRPSRNSSDFGKLGDVGKGGYVYSATTGTTPLRLAIESGVVYFGATDSRSHGFSVRCVRE